MADKRPIKKRPLGDKAPNAPSVPKPAFNNIVFRQPDKIVHADSGRTLLIDAILKGDEKRIEALLHSGANAGKCDKSGKTPLHYAARLGQSDTVMMLIKQGAAVNPRDKTLATPLVEALDGPQPLEMVKLLLSMGADANIADKNNRVPLHTAAQKSGKDVVVLLARATENPGRPDKTQMTAMHEACQKNSLDVVQALLAERISIFNATIEGNTALHFAMQREDASVGFFLLSTEAAQLANAANLDGVTPMHLAVKEGKVDLIRRALQVGGDPNFADKRGFAALHYAAGNGSDAAVLLLLRNGADLNKGTGISGNITPLLQAVSSGKPSVVQLLLDHAADPSLVAKGDVTPVMMAIYQRNAAVLEVLLKAGANVNHVSQRGQTALYTACSYKLDREVAMLLAAGADPNVPSHSGRTPLHVLTDEPVYNMAMIAAILNAGGDPLKKDQYGDTPYDQASSRGRSAIVELFKKKLDERGVKYTPRRPPGPGWDY